MIFDFECPAERLGCQASASRFRLPYAGAIPHCFGVPGPDTSRISPTAHYTSYVWYRHGLSHPMFASKVGRGFHAAASVVEHLSSRFGGPTVEAMLLTRHHLIDQALERAIASGQIAQVVEVASGLSFRGVRFCRRHPGLLFIEGDLPGMSAQKRADLEQAKLRSPRHEVVSLNALADDGDDSIAAVMARHLDPSVPTAIVTEGLLPYFDAQTVEAMWRRFARALAEVSGGLYVSDLYLGDPLGKVWGVRAALFGVSVVARGSVHLHYADAKQAQAALAAAGFDSSAILDKRDLEGERFGKGAGLARIVEARIGGFGGADGGDRLR